MEWELGKERGSEARVTEALSGLDKPRTGCKRTQDGTTVLLEFCIQRSPVMWHSAQAAYVSKHNGKAWTEGERVVMVMCPLRSGVSSEHSAEGAGRFSTHLLSVDVW